MPGVYGLSAQYHPGSTVNELAAAGRFRNNKISYATESEVRSSGIALGYSILIIPSPGRGYHATLEAIEIMSDRIVIKLPDELASAISAVFYRQRPNPYKSIR
jgi:hypothetical protein